MTVEVYENDGTHLGVYLDVNKLIKGIKNNSVILQFKHKANKTFDNVEKVSYSPIDGIVIFKLAEENVYMLTSF